MVIDLSKMEGLKRGVVNKVLRQSQAEASKIVKTAVKNNAYGLARYGFLAKSIGSKIKTYTSVAVAIIGPRSKYIKTRGDYTRGKQKGQPRIVRPSQYAHLVERGGKHIKPKPFLAAAMETTKESYWSALCKAIDRRISSILK